MSKSFPAKLAIYTVCLAFLVFKNSVSYAEENKIIIIKKVIENNAQTGPVYGPTKSNIVEDKNNKKNTIKSSKNVNKVNRKNNKKKKDNKSKKGSKNSKVNTKTKINANKSVNKNNKNNNKSKQNTDKIVDINKVANKNAEDTPNNKNSNTGKSGDSNPAENHAVDLITNTNGTSTSRRPDVKNDNKNDNNTQNDNDIIGLIDEKENSSIPKKKIKINTRNKGVPSVCLMRIHREKQNEKKVNKELEKAKSNLKSHIKNALIDNGISDNLVKYISDNLIFLERTTIRNDELKKRTMTDTIRAYKVPLRSDVGRAYKQLYYDNLKLVEELFEVEPNIILAIWAMETNYGSFIGNYNVFSALYSACLNSDSIKRLRYFENNIISLAILFENGFFNKDVVSSFDGGLGGCQFMPLSVYDYAVSLFNEKPDIMNNNSDVFASIGNYLNSKGWRHNEGILSEVQLPNKFNICNVGMNTIKSVAEWKAMGIRPNGIGREYMKNDSTMASIIVVDVDNPNVPKKDKRAFLVYDNFKVILTYNPRLQYAITAGLIYEGIGKR